MRPSEGSRRHRAGSVERLLIAVVGGQPVAAAAKLAGMGEETARRRLREPDIAARLNELRIATLAAASDRLTSLALAASEVLATVMSDPQMPPTVRVRAASE